MTTPLKSEERLIVAADFSSKECGGHVGARSHLFALTKALNGLGVTLKINSILRAEGYSLIKQLHEAGLKVMADLKLVDIGNTLETDGDFLLEYAPDLLTVMCSAGVEGMQTLKGVFRDTPTEVLGVTVLTNMDDDSCRTVYGSAVEPKVMDLAVLASAAGLDGLVCSAQELTILRERGWSMSLNTPGIRPAWASVKSDDQKRVATPASPSPGMELWSSSASKSRAARGPWSSRTP